MYISDEQFNRIITLAQEYGANKLILFGSLLTNPQEAHDIDLACDGVSGWKLFELAARLEDELDIPLDLVPLSPQTRFTTLVEQHGRRLL